jgi:hypothetical protein
MHGDEPEGTGILYLFLSRILEKLPFFWSYRLFPNYPFRQIRNKDARWTFINSGIAQLCGSNVGTS